MSDSSRPKSSGHGQAKRSTSGDNVKVVVRIRPPNEAEGERFHSVTEAISDHMLVFDPKVQRPMGFLPPNHRDVNRRRFKDLKYAFDYVFGPSSSNKDVFEQTTGSIVKGVLNGYNCSVFAYGATGAGKTHTMLGNSQEPGVIYHTMIDLYKRINEQRDEKCFDVAVSYSEVYNEQVRDLLMPRGNLPIREDKTVGVIIAGLSLHKPKSAEELLHMLHFGNKNRTQHPTDANAESSRSHAVFQVFVNQRQRCSNFNSEVKMAKMCLVDLAGSERATHTTNQGARFREGANINRSLLALGNVINALADNKFKGHIPYRDSKLTRLLKDSLGGNCHTVMIAAVSPSSRSFEDTYNTLRYADRAKHIRADLKKNVMNVDFHVANYKKYVQELEKENQELRQAKQKLMERLEGNDTLTACPPLVKRFQEKLVEVFKARKEIRKSQVASDGAKRELKWKVARKEQTIRRVQKLTESMHVIGKHSRVVERMKRRIETEDADLKASTRRLQDQEDAIQSLYSEAVSALRRSKSSPEVLDLSIKMHSAEASLHDTHMYLAFVKKMARAQERQAVVNEKLISCLLQLVRKQHEVLLGKDLLNSDLRCRYEKCCYLVEERGVAWAQGHREGSPASPVINNMDTGVTEDEEMCISDIIDFPVPRLHVNLFRSESSPSPNGKSSEQSQPLPQRVVKPTFAVKPAARTVSTSCSGGNTEGPQRPSPVSSGYKMPSSQPLGQQRPQGPVSSLPTAPVVKGWSEIQTPSVNATTAANSENVIRTCPEYNSSKRESPSLHCNKNFLYCNPAAVPRVTSAEGQIQASCAVKSTTKQELEKQPPSSGLTTSTGQPRSVDSSAAAAGEERSRTDSASNENLNDTFEVIKPALPNTPCIDNCGRSRVASAVKDYEKAAADAAPLSQTRSSAAKSPQGLRRHRMRGGKDKSFLPQKLIFGKEEVSKITQPLIDVSPSSRQKAQTMLNVNLPANVSTQGTNTGTQVTDHDTRPTRRRLSADFRSHACNKSKSEGTATSPSQGSKQGGNENHASLSPTSQSPSPVQHVQHGVISRSRSLQMGLNSTHHHSYSHAGGENSAVAEHTSRRHQALCSNSNNMNVSTSSHSSPKSYADAVRSPAPSSVDLPQSTSMPSTPIASHGSENPAASAMKTPDFSNNPYMTQVMNSLKKHGMPCLTEAFSASKAKRLEGTGRRREALKQLNTNTLAPAPVSSSDSSAEKTPDPDVFGECSVGKQTLGVGRVLKNSTKERRHNRALASNPYLRDRVHNVKKHGFPSALDVLSKVNHKQSSDTVGSSQSQPSYMLPTISTSQRILRMEREKLMRIGARNQRQPYSIPKTTMAGQLS